ncbi:uncharacterized protein N0V96_003442 [Colletotrichum fioriniae]|uniref:uncharacterized protein n=1 Tax=Colletotrichum fioriniae TaxID=710243 RepID=UPI0032DA12C0|nr:hypothetical protein N0V96_003442 [Colletotrichum fioriniae]
MTFTTNLLTTHKALYHASTTSAFLAAAALGQVPKPILGRWLANDRLYIHAYIKGAGRFLALLDLPDVVESASRHDNSGHDAGSATAVTEDGAADRATTTVTERLLHWLIDALVNVRREEKFFIDVAARFGINVNLPAEPTSQSGSSTNRRVSNENKNAGLLAFERLFTSINTTPPRGGLLLPWLAPAVLFWATEKCYLEACLAFRTFVDELASIIDDGVDEAVQRHGEEAVRNELDQAMVMWERVLLAENDFWPREMEEGGLRRVRIN